MGSESSEWAWSNSSRRWFGHQSRLVRGPLGAAPWPAADCPWWTGHFAADAFTSDFASEVNSVPLLAIESLLQGCGLQCLGFHGRPFHRSPAITSWFEIVNCGNAIGGYSSNARRRPRSLRRIVFRRASGAKSAENEFAIANDPFTQGALGRLGHVVPLQVLNI